VRSGIGKPFKTASPKLNEATRWYRGIMKSINRLTGMPLIHSLARENGKSNSELRELHFDVSSKTTHRVDFRIDKELIVVIAVRHTAQDDLSSEDLTAE